jgi:hypothetical protein
MTSEASNFVIETCEIELVACMIEAASATRRLKNMTASEYVAFASPESYKLFRTVAVAAIDYFTKQVNASRRLQ